ncbi:MAG: hypothetical protein EA355_15710 [Rhodobacteraceae bacterium]|nr:MAG: hypothetical protein EA355_15710 [Paracoccaceae bacterium]
MPILLMVAALIAGFSGQTLLVAAREHVRNAWPDWYATLSGEGSRLRLGGAHERARRRLVGPLFRARFPEGPDGDAALLRLAALFRFSVIALIATAGGAFAIIALRAAAA